MKRRWFNAVLLAVVTETLSGCGIAFLNPDPANDDWDGWDASLLSTSSFSNLPNPGEFFLPALGIPSSVNSDGTIANSSLLNIHGDLLWITTSIVRGATAGGLWNDGSAAGRFSLNLDRAPAGTDNTVGGRCGLPADP